MTRRLSKDERIAREKQTLRDRVEDMLLGIAGCHLEDDSEGDVLITPSIDLEGLSNWIRAMELTLSIDPSTLTETWTEEKQRKVTFAVQYLRHFETLNTTVEYLYAQGFRA